MTAIRNNTLRSQSKENAIDSAKALKDWISEHGTLLEVFLDAYCIVDLSNRVVAFNVAFTDLCGESYRRALKIGSFCDLIRTERCPKRCPAVESITNGKPIRLDELKGATKAFPELSMILGAVPLFSNDKTPIGSLVTIRNVSAESELQRKYDERKRDSITDGLTRLFNKTYAESVLTRMIKASARDKMPLSLVMCDIDHFKHVNDIHGHQAGDFVLATVAQMLKGEARETDIIGRFGGEEFICILHNTDQAGAHIFSERFRKHVASTKILFEGGRHIPITVSLGTATFRSDWQSGFDGDVASRELINQADTALYLAKANGRNQTWQFENMPKKK